MNTRGNGLVSWCKPSVLAAVVFIFLTGLFAQLSCAAPFNIATNGAAQSFAFDGTNYLVGIESHTTSPPTIGAQLIDASGAKVGPFITTGRTGIATNVAFDGTNYLLIWEDAAASPNFQVYGVFISKAGVAGTPFPISGTDINFDGVKVMAFGGGKYLVTYTKLISTNRYIYGRIVNPDGSPMAAEFQISTGTGKASDVAFDGSTFFVVWCDDANDSEIRGRFVNPAGVAGLEISVNNSSAPSDNPKSVAYDGSNYLVVWNDEVGGQGTFAWDVFGQRVGTGGSLVGGVISITEEPGPQMVTSVAFDGTSYMAVWMDMANDANGSGTCDGGEGTCWDMYGQYIDISGSLFGSKITVSNAAGNQMGGVGFANGSYLMLVNNGVVMGQGGIISVTDATGQFVIPETPPPPVAPNTLFPIAANGASTSFAFDGTNYLVGVVTPLGLTPPERSNIGAQLVSAAGAKVGELISTGRTGVATNVAFDGTNYLLTWEDDNGGTLDVTSGWQVWGQFISQAGALVGPAFQISSSGIWFDGNRSMTFGGGKYLVTYTKLRVPADGALDTNRYIVGRIVDPTSGPVGSEFQINETNAYGAASEVAFDGDNFFVVWREDFADQNIMGRFVTTSGAVLGTTDLTLNASGFPSDNPYSLAFDGTNYLLVWNNEVGGAGSFTWDVFGQRISTSGVLVGSPFTITNEAGPQIVTTVAFDGTNFLAVWIDMSGADWNMYGQYFSRNGTLVGGKITISTAATNQMGGVGFANGRYLVLVNNGVVMGDGGITGVTDANGMFVTAPTNQFSGNGTYTYSGDAGGGTLSWNWSDLNFICNGPTFGPGSQNITVLNETTLTWTETEGGGMTWTRASGTAGDITGTWTAVDAGSGSFYTLTFSGTAAAGTVTIAADIFTCGSNGPPTITAFSPSSGKIGDLVTISGTNFSPLASDNIITFNGMPAVVAGVRAGSIYVLVPPGAADGPITFTNSNGTVSSTSINTCSPQPCTPVTTFTVTQDTPAATLSWGGVHHRIGSDGIEFDALDAGISSYATTLAGMTLTVSGPNGFSYSFTDADIDPYLYGQLAVYRKYPTPGSALEPGVYTFTLNDGQGHISHRVDTHVTVAALPQVDSATIQLQRTANTSNGPYRISWAPVNDTQTYNYRVRINRNDSSETNVYDGSRNTITYADIPAEVLFDDSTYMVRVETVNSSSGDLATNSSHSAWKLFSPLTNDYDANRLVVNYATLWNRLNSDSTQATDVILGVNTPAALATAISTDASALQLLNSTGTVIYSFTPGDRSGNDFYKQFTSATTPTTLAAGAYTIRFRLSSTSTYNYAYANLTPRVDYPLPDSSTMKAEDLGTGSIRFSWANVNHVGALYYRVTVSDAAGAQITSARANQTFADIPSSSINTLGTGKRWRVEVYDSNQIYTQRNRSNGTNVFFVSNTIPLPFDAAAPVINSYRVRNVIKSTGLPYTQVAVSATGAQSVLTSILVTGPSYSRELLSVGRYVPSNGSYTLEEPGTLTPGLYTITVTNAAGKGAIRYMYAPAASSLPQPDYTTTQIDTEPNGDMRISWAPVVSSVPVWYSFRMYSLTDQDGDELPDAIYTQSVGGSNNFQVTSIVVPAGAITMEAAAQVSVSDGSGSTVISNASHSVFVGPGGVPVTDPFAAGNDGLATAVYSTSPGNGATDVPTTGSTFSVTFNKVIDQRSLPASFTVNKGITGTVSYNPSTRTATFTPSVDLLPGTTYTATLSTGLLDQAGNALGAPYSWSFTAAGNRPELSVTIAGGGNVNSDIGSPGIHGTAPGTYTSSYEWNDSVLLTATAHTGWDFSGWSGACTGISPTCTLNMEFQQLLTSASFTVQQNTKIGTSYYGTIQDAFDAALAGQELLLREMTFTEVPAPVFRSPGVELRMVGGYDAGFGTNAGTTLISGSLKIQNGTLRVQKIAIVP